MSKYKPRSLKFAGEDSFIVPKPGTKKYLMAIATEQTLVDQQNAINAEVVPLDATTIVNPTVSPSDSQTATTPPVMIGGPDWTVLDCAAIAKELENLQNMLMVSKFSSEVYDAYQKIIQEGQSVYANKCLKTPTPIDIEPTPLPPAPPVYSEPSWSTMTCEQIKTELNAISMMLADPNTSAENLSILKMSYDNGIKAYARCNVSEVPLEPMPPVSSGGGGVGAPPITTITTTGTPIIATATAGGLTSSGMPKSLGGGGGGGGAKEEPKPKEKGFNWWWLVAGAAVIYLYSTRKS